MGLFDTVEGDNTKPGKQLSVKKAPPTSLDKVIKVYEHMAQALANPYICPTSKAAEVTAPLKKISVTPHTISEFCMRLGRDIEPHDTCTMYLLRALVECSREQGDTHFVFPAEHLSGIELHGSVSKQKLPSASFEIYGECGMHNIANVTAKIHGTQLNRGFSYLSNATVHIEGDVDHLGRGSRNCFFSVDGYVKSLNTPILDKSAEKCTFVFHQKLHFVDYFSLCTIASKNESVCKSARRWGGDYNHIYHIQDDGKWKAYNIKTKLFGWMRRKHGNL